MPLDPDIADFLDVVQMQGKPAIHELSLAQARAEYEKASLTLGTPAERTDWHDFRIATRDGDTITLRHYRPATGGCDLLLYFHGGGYVLGNLETHHALCQAIVIATGRQVVAVDYRLAPEHRFPTAYLDAEDAYRWIFDNAVSLAIDPARLAVGGDSVGGTLATALCLSVRTNGLQPPAYQVLLYPCTSAWQDSPSHTRYARDHLLEHETLQWMFGHYLNDDRERRDWRFAPLEADDLKDLPDAFIGLAEHDPLVDEGHDYASRLSAWGNSVEERVYPGMIHDFARLGSLAPTGAQRIIGDIASFLRD